VGWRRSTAGKYRNRYGSGRTRIHAPGAVTCRDGRGWTACLLFASRGSGVRVPLAPLVRVKIRTAEPESTAVKYRNRHGTRFRTGVRVGTAPGRGSKPPRQLPGAEPELRAAEQEEHCLSGPVPSVHAPPISVQVLPLYRWLLPRIQRVSSVVEGARNSATPERAP